jgi:hypothetical protein
LGSYYIVLTDFSKALNPSLSLSTPIVSNFSK